MTFLTFKGSRDLSRASFYFARFASSQGAQYKIIKIRFVASMIAVTPAMESIKASLASW